MEAYFHICEHIIFYLINQSFKISFLKATDGMFLTGIHPSKYEYTNFKMNRKIPRVNRQFQVLRLKLQIIHENSYVLVAIEVIFNLLKHWNFVQPSPVKIRSIRFDEFINIYGFIADHSIIFNFNGWYWNLK